MSLYRCAPCRLLFDTPRTDASCPVCGATAMRIDAGSSIAAEVRPTSITGQFEAVSLARLGRGELDDPEGEA